MRIWIFIAMLAGLAGCAESPFGPAATTATPEGLSMRAALADVDQVRVFAYGGGDQARARRAAEALVNWSATVPTLFPPDKVAQTYVDLGPQRARVAAAAMSRAAVALEAATKMGDPKRVAAELVQTERQGCGACHLAQAL